jgi:hypothetical protein
MAILGGCILAISPVTNAYVWQLRGYSLTLFLSTLGMTGVLHAASAPKRALLATSLSCLLLPLVIPSNAMVAPVLGVAFAFRLDGLRKRLGALLCVAVSAALGLSYYLTIWPQFMKAMAEPDGWQSGWRVSGALLCGLAAHLLSLCSALFPFRRAEKGPLALAGILLLASCAVGAFVLLISRDGHAPFPRVFLVLFPPLTAAALLALRNSAAPLRRCIATAILFGAIVSMAADSATAWMLSRGKVPDNLLCQYYRGSTELREAAALLSSHRTARNVLIFTDPYDFPAMQFYWALAGQDGKHVRPSNRTEESLPAAPVLVIARTEKEMVRICTAAAQDASRATLLKSLKIRKIYLLNEQYAAHVF